jgi:hypothetical protein
MMVSPHDIKQLAETMGIVLGDADLRARLIAAGREQVRKFNWYRVARNTLAVYYEVYNSAPEHGGGRRKFLPFDLWKGLRDVEVRSKGSLLSSALADS